MAALYLSIGISLSVLLYGAVVQRKIVDAEEKIDNAFSQIGISQQLRFDALTQLYNMVKDYKAYEVETLAKIIRSRKSSISVGMMNEQEMQLDKAFSNIVALAENYPDLKASEVYLNTMNNLQKHEEMVRHSRMVYNDCVTKYNRILKQFPDTLFLQIGTSRERKQYLVTDKEKHKMPDFKPAYKR